MPTPTYEPIATALASVDTSTISFNSIPQTYNHLIIAFYARSTRTGNVFDRLFLRFNGDTGTNYSTVAAQYLSASGLVSPNSESTANPIYLAEGIPTADTPAGQYAYIRIDIPSYRNSTWKTATAILFGEQTNLAALSVGAELWKSTSSISSMALECTNQWVAGSQFTLYGVV